MYNRVEKERVGVPLAFTKSGDRIKVFYSKHFLGGVEQQLIFSVIEGSQSSELFKMVIGVLDFFSIGVVE